MNRSIVDEAEHRGRRRALLRGAACAISFIGVGPVLGTTIERWREDRAIGTNPEAVTSDVFAYPTRGGRSTVIAATWNEPPRIDGSVATSEITIHSGTYRWTGLVEAGPKVTYAPELDHRASIGSLARERPSSAGRLMGFFIEAPTDALAGGKTLRVWAERRLIDGSRRRIGSPLMAPLIAAHPALSKAYHESEPPADRDLLLPDLREAIASNARLDADDLRARRLADRLADDLLPDVLHYDPSHPCGFTFAARNGRFPSDRCDAIVRSILTRSVSS